VIIKPQMNRCQFEGCVCAHESGRCKLIASNTSMFANSYQKSGGIPCGSVSEVGIYKFLCFEKQPDPSFQVFLPMAMYQEWREDTLRGKRWPCDMGIPCDPYYYVPGHSVKYNHLKNKWQMELASFRAPVCSDGTYGVVQVRYDWWWRSISMAFGYLIFIEMVATASVMAMYFTYTSGTFCWCSNSKLQYIFKVATEAQTQVEPQNLRANR